MESTNRLSWKSACTIAAVIVSIFAWLGLSGDIAMEQTKGKNSVQDTSSFGKYSRKPVKMIELPVAKIDDLKATEIALKKIPGKANSVKIERIGKHNVYTVEIIADKDGVEWDVFVDIKTGEVVGTDN
jgi:uncharacterized membrane protein YkoI